MLVDKELIIQAKDKLGENGAEIIANDLGIEQWNPIDLKGCCPFHKEDTPSFLWNPKDNSFKCFGCGKNYGIIDHYIHYYKMTFLESVQMLFDKVGIKHSFGEKGIKTEKDYVYPKHECFESRNKVEGYLSLRKISKETLDYMDIQQDNNGNIVFHFVDANDVLTLVKYRSAKKLEKSEIKSWCQKGASTKPILFNMNRIDPTQPLLIHEGEIDCLSSIESGFKNAVSVPFGSQDMTWIEENWDWLEQFKKIIVWSDNDKPGIEMRKNVCSRLGTWRTYFVDLPKQLEKEDGAKVNCKDANEVLYNFDKDKVLEFINDAHEVPVANVLDLSKVEDFDIETAQGLFSSLKDINSTIYKYIFGSVIILTGVRASGKSSFLNQEFICEPLNQGHDVFIFSGELGSPVLKTWIETSMAGREKIRMKNDFVRIVSPETRLQIREWYEKRIWCFDSTTNDAEVILDRAVNVTRRFGVKIWVLDNLMTLDIGANNDSNLWQKQKEFIVKLVNLANNYNVLIVLVAHPRKTTELRRITAEDVSGSNDLGNLAQYILGVHRYTKAEKEGQKDSKGNYKRGFEPVKEDVEISIFKNRYTGKVDNWKEYFDYPSMRFYSNTQELYKRYKWNRDTSPIPTTDPNKHEDTPDWVGD